MGIRSLFGGFDESVLPGSIDGEKRNLTSYNEVLVLAETGSVDLLTAQRAQLEQKIRAMEITKRAST